MADNENMADDPNLNKSTTAAVGSLPQIPCASNTLPATQTKEYFTPEGESQRNVDKDSSVPRVDASSAPTPDMWNTLFQSMISSFKNTPPSGQGPVLDSVGTRKMKASEIYLPTFDPDECQFTAVQWCEEIEHHQQHNSWTDYETRNAAFTHLQGRAKKWADRSYPLCKTWAEVKERLTRQFAATKRFHDLFRDMVDYTSDRAATYVEYSTNKLALIDRLESGWNEQNKIEVVISGITDVQVPSYYTVVVLGFYLLVAFLTQLVEDDMPTPVTDAEITRENTIAFSEELGLQYLHKIMGTEPRVSGAVYHLRQTEELQALLLNITSGSTIPVQVDWQLATGDYRLDHQIPYVNWYNNVSNIIALLEGESGVQPNGDLGTSLLLNCHYDSVPFALGASDNVVFCAIMAETLHRLAQRTTKFKHNLIFLFNGAEENPLQGSHAFLQHPWAKNITAVVNLDAAGMNGKANLFQVLDPRLARAYEKSTNRPSAQSFGEFLFSSGLVPSDTDFRIWRDFGQFYGIDIAFVKWGNVYHTRNDRPELLAPGVLQAAGDMFYNLVGIIADMPELAEKAEPETVVYYDYLNSFMVTYPLWASYIVDPLIAVVALTSVGYYVHIVGVRRSTFRGLAWAALGRAASVAAGAVATLLCVLLMIATTTQLRYLSNQWIVVPIYWVPYVIVVTFVSQLYDAWSCKKSGLNRSFRALQASAATRLLLAIILIVITCMPSLVSLRYVIGVPLFLMSVFSVFPLALVRYLRVPAWQQLLVEMLLSVPVVMFLFSLSLRIDSLMLPVMGRSTNDRPDFLVGMLNLGLAVLVTSAVSGIELLFSRRSIWLPAGLVGVAALVFMFLPLDPFDANGTSLQRHYWFHTEIINWTENPPTRVSGVMVSKQDPYGVDNVRRILENSHLNYTVNTDFAEDCERQVFCNMPLYRTRFTGFFAQALFINMPPPAAFVNQPRLWLDSKVCSGTNCTLSFAFDGPAHNTLSLWPRSSEPILAWSFDSPCVPSFDLNGRPVYVIVQGTATYQEQFNTLYFWITLNVPVAQQSQAVVDVSQHAHKKQHPEEFTREYQELLDAMPDYLNIDSSLSIRNNYAF